MYAGGCQIFTFQYRTALETLSRAGELASRARDDTVGGGVAISQSALYSQLGDSSDAHRNIRTAVQLLDHSPHRDYLAEALVNMAQIQSDEGDITSATFSFSRGISVADQAGLVELETVIRDQFGISLLLAGKAAEAEHELNDAYSLEIKTKDLDMRAMTVEHLAELELHKGNYASALARINEAFSLPSPTFKTSPQYYPINIRGCILLGLGRETEALASFRKAVDSASIWRRGALPGDVTSTRTCVRLHKVYADYIDLAATRSIRMHDGELMREAFEIMAQHRAATLRERMAMALERQGALPPHYFELLSQLESAQERVTLGTSTSEDRANLDKIRDQLADSENRIGLQLKINKKDRENPSDKKSLRDIQDRLSANELLLSFWLGNKRSFLWTITGDRVSLYELPRQADIERRTTAFSQALENGKPTGNEREGISRMLFGPVSPEAARKAEWLIVGDGGLLKDLPFAALAEPGAPEPLIAKHTVRALPSELLLTGAREQLPQARFIGIADPIYNAADSRFVRKVAFSNKHDEAPIALGRLAGSAREVRSAASASGIAQAELILGTQATVDSLAAALRQTPQILHLAVHIVSPPGKPGEAALALSLNPANNMPDLLTAERVAAFRLPGTLVVMSGCASEQGEVLPSAGLQGLSRAWLLAGAAAVVVSAWPTPDDSGRFFSSFYNYLRTSESSHASLAVRASVALQRAQLDMQREKGYRSSPRFWAAYSVIAKE